MGIAKSCRVPASGKGSCWF